MQATARVFAITVLAAGLALAQSERSAEAQLKAAMHKEQVEGDLKEAIRLYQRIVDKHSANREVAARALLQIGQCYEKLGLADARKAYERLLREYADQTQQAEGARVRLAALERAGGLSYPSGITLRKVWAIDHGWIEGAPSPDGRYHSFTDWDTGNLALRDLATGEISRLTNEGDMTEPVAFAESSVISGDGRRIAYTWHNKEQWYEVRVIGIDGSDPRTVYRDKEFGYWVALYQWTADGKQILAVLMRSEKEWRFALIPAAGGPVRILKTPSPHYWGVSLSPDGRFLVCDTPGEKPDESDICLLPLERDQEVILVRSPAQDTAPVWMPDGKRVLFVSDRTGTNGFWAIDVVEGKPQGIPQLLKDGVGREIRPNGFTRQGAFYFSTTTSVADVYVAELDQTAGKVVRQPAAIAPRLAGSNWGPSWSPDGRRLAYYSRLKWGEAPKLMILSVDTGEAREVPIQLDSQLFAALWLPDGKSVIVGAERTPTRDVLGNYRVDVQTGEHVLVRSFRYPIPGAGDISPDGKTHFWFTREEPKPGLGVISCDMATGEQREIARVSDLARGGFPSLKASPDSKYLALRLPVNGGQWAAVRVASATGGEWRELCRFPKSEFAEGSWDLAWTPNGGNVLIVRRTGKDGMPELWRIPIAGGEPQRTGLSDKVWAFSRFTRTAGGSPSTRATAAGP